MHNKLTEKICVNKDPGRMWGLDYYIDPEHQYVYWCCIMINCS